MPIFFAASLFLSAALLFLVQPMCAKMVLPFLGGTPGVWNTCMVFFQAGLLAGYAYAHAAPRWLGRRPHAVLHVLLFALPFLLLPIVIAPEEDPGDAFPFFWLLGILLVSAGFPYLMLASSAPLLQSWFAGTRHPRAGDPYFLYAASNLGSMLALVSYPFLVEPNLTLPEQSGLWKAGYGLLIVATSGCALLMWRYHGETGVRNQKTGDRNHHAGEKPGTLRREDKALRGIASWRRVRWLLLALVPSSLMLSVTAHLTADIAAIPLLWVAPLALYLLTFILVFAGKPLLPHPLFVRWLPLVVMVLVAVRLSEATESRTGGVVVLLALHLLGLFWIAMVCHGELARTRPEASHLTEYYLWLALGGVLGGLFNALLAPLLFSTLLEYPLMLVLACLLRPPDRDPRLRNGPRERVFDFALPVLLGALTAGLVLLERYLRLDPGPISVGMGFGLPLLICYTFMARPIRLGLGLGAILLASGFYAGVYGQAQFRVRSFFGVHRVTQRDGYRLLIHGNTIHGMQSLDPVRQAQPLSYYYRDPTGRRSSPIGQIFAALKDDQRVERVGVVGLGAGAMACYARPGRHWTFFEIDPAVVDLARNRFTYLDNSRGRIDIETGDGRLALTRSDERYGVLVIDAFSSDSIPLHLLTRQALAIYRDRVSDQGILAFHISNRYLNLEPVLANLAADCDPPWLCWIQRDRTVTDAEREDGKSPSDWVILARHSQNAAAVVANGFWEPCRPDLRLRVWTDDFSNLFDVLSLRSGHGP